MNPISVNWTKVWALAKASPYHNIDFCKAVGKNRAWLRTAAVGNYRISPEALAVLTEMLQVSADEITTDEGKRYDVDWLSVRETIAEAYPTGISGFCRDLGYTPSWIYACYKQGFKPERDLLEAMDRLLKPYGSGIDIRE